MQVKPITIYLSASDVATSIGKNQYRLQDDFLMSTWKNVFPDTYNLVQLAKRNKLLKLGITTPKENVNTVESVTENIVLTTEIDKVANNDDSKTRVEATSTIIDNVVKNYNESAISELKSSFQHAPSLGGVDIGTILGNDLKETAQKIKDVLLVETQDVKKQAVLEELQTDINNKIINSEKIKNAISSRVNTFRGKRDEPLALLQVEKCIKRKLKETGEDAKMFYKRVPISIKDSNGKEVKYSVKLGGKVDGIIDEESITEVKNRQNRLFKKVPVYEEVQVQTYLFITGRKTCHFLEKYKASTWETRILSSDNYFKNVIVQGLTDFVEKLHKLNNK